VGPLRARPAGVGVYVASLAQALAELLDEGTLVFFGRRPDAAGLPEGVRSTGRSARLPYSAWTQLLAAGRARATRADVVHFTDGLAPVLPWPRAPRPVVSVHDLTLVSEWRTHRAVRWARIPLVLAAPRLAAAVLVPSRATADEVVRRSRTPARRIHVIPLAGRPDVSLVQPEVTSAVLRRHGLEPERYVLAPGTLEPRKNHLRLIDAYERALRSGAIETDTRLVISGGAGWGHGAIVRRVRASPFADRILVTGYLPAHDLAALLTGAGAVAFVSLAEGFGMPILEAMACGAAVVTSDRSSMPEVAGDAAVLVDPLDVSDIAAGLGRAMEARRLDREAVVQRAVARARSFTWAETAARTAEIYRAVA
jgi:alpha-1,3-rhamnosyl/mannosyltransferase